MVQRLFWKQKSSKFMICIIFSRSTRLMCLIGGMWLNSNAKSPQKKVIKSPKKIVKAWSRFLRYRNKWVVSLLQSERKIGLRKILDWTEKPHSFFGGCLRLLPLLLSSKILPRLCMCPTKAALIILVDSAIYSSAQVTSVQYNHKYLLLWHTVCKIKDSWYLIELLFWSFSQYVSRVVKYNKNSFQYLTWQGNCKYMQEM